MSDIMAFTNLNILNSREILICYGRKQPISETLIKCLKKNEITKIKALSLGQDLLHEITLKLRMLMIN